MPPRNPPKGTTYTSGSGTIQATPRNSLLGAVADGFTSLRDGANRALYFKDNVPLLGGMGLGDLLLGQSPEEFNEWSYGNSPFEVPKTGMRLPILKNNRQQQVADVLMFPVAETAALGKLAASGAKGAGRKLAETVGKDTSTSRRDFLKKSGAAVGTVAAGRGILDIGDDLAKGAMKTTARTIMSPAEAQRLLQHAALDARKVVQELLQTNPEYQALVTQKQKLLEQIDMDVKKRTEQYLAERPDINRDDFYNDPVRVDIYKDKFAAEHHLSGKIDVIERSQREMRDKLLFPEIELAERKYRTKYPELNNHMSQYEIEMRYDPAGDNDTAVTEYLKSVDLKPNDEIESIIRKGGTYTNPYSGNTAVLDDYGNLLWSNGESISEYEAMITPRYELDWQKLNK